MEWKNFIEQRMPYDHKADLKPVTRKKRSEIGHGEAQLQTDLTVSTNQQNGSRSSMVHKRTPVLRNGCHLLAECCLGTVQAWLGS